jgi:hypothetical protein
MAKGVVVFELIKRKNGTRRRARDGEVIYTCGVEEFFFALRELF